MKKFTALLSCFILLSAFTCENEPLDNDIQIPTENTCSAAVQATAVASQNFSEATPDTYEGLCNQLHTALEAQIIACGDSNGSLQLTIDALGCSTVEMDPCVAATNIVSLAEIAYNEATDANFTQICLDYKQTLETQQIICGDEDGSIQTVIDSLGDCSNDNNPNPTGFAMTFIMNDIQYQINTPFNNNEASSTTIFSAYPPEEYILLQGRNGFVGNIEVDLWIRREHLISGISYEVNTETEETTTHIDLIDNSNSVSEQTISGTVYIDFADTENKIVRGRFDFITAEYWTEDINHVITDGTFDYVYDVE